MTPEGVTGALQNRGEGRREDEFNRVKGGVMKGAMVIMMEERNEQQVK